MLNYQTIKMTRSKSRLSISRIVGALLLCSAASAYGQGGVAPGPSVSLAAATPPATTVPAWRDRPRQIRGEWRAAVSAADTEAPAAEPGARLSMGLAADSTQESQAVTAAPRTGPISGYMDFHINDPQYADAVLDFHRFVLLLTHSFSDRIRFVSELELEHTVVSDETKGELELEQAYVDFLISRPFSMRAGIVLAPVGIINERHEPPVFHGVERPAVDTVIIPTTWFGAGAGVHGEIGAGFRYRAYAMETLDATGFSAERGAA